MSDLSAEQQGRAHTGWPPARQSRHPASLRSTRVATISCAAAGLLLLASFGFQLVATQTRWVTHAQGSGGFPIQDSRFDYYLSVDPVILLPGTHLPFGIGMLLQAVGITFLLACLLHLTGHTKKWTYLSQLLLGLCAISGFAFIGVVSVRTARTGQLIDVLSAHGLLLAWLLLIGPVLLGLAVLAWKQLPDLGIAFGLTFFTSPVGSAICLFFLAPAVNASDIEYGTFGWETIMAVTTLLAGLVAVIVAIGLGHRSGTLQDTGNG